MFDRMLKAEPGLAAVLALPVETCTPAQLIDRIAAVERLGAALQAMQLRDVDAFAKARVAGDRVLPGVDDRLAARVAKAEVACARGVAPSTAGYQIELAQLAVEDHPRLLDQVASGRISLAALRKVVEQTAVLDGPGRRQVDAALAELVTHERLTPAKLADAAARQVIGVDPDAAMRRCEAARADQGIAVLDKRDGAAALWTRLPAEDIAACHQTLLGDAKSMRNAGDTRSLMDIMCTAFVHRLTASTLIPPGATGARRRVELQVVMAASTLLGVDDAPATLRGHGAIPADLARRIADGPDTALRRLICDPVDGRLLTMDTRTRCYEGLKRALITWRDQVSRFPGSNSPIAEIDHLLEHRKGGHTSPANGQGLDKSMHPVRDHPGVTVVAKPTHRRRLQLHRRRRPAGPSLEQMRRAAPTITWTMPTGHTYDSRPPPALGWGSRFTVPPHARRIPRSRIHDRWHLRTLRHRLTTPPPDAPQRT